MAESLVFLSGKRTLFGANGGSLKDAHPTELSVAASKAALEQARLEPKDIDHVIFGNVLYSTADTIYIPRHIGLKLGVPQAVPALGINRLCGTGFQVIVEAYHQMLAGDTQVALVGGVENMSLTPYALRGVRWGTKMGHQQVADVMMDSLTDSYIGTPMALTAEKLAEQYKITREQTDAFALRSQTKYKEAQAEGRFNDEIAPYAIVDRKGNSTSLSKDEHPKGDATMESLGKLRPVFKKDGVVTAGNASGIVDGAAAMVVSTESYAKQNNLAPLGRMVAYGISGCDPTVMGIGPVPAAQQALKRAGMTMGQMDLVEVNEAFSSQALAVQKELGISDDVYNVNGGAVAIGHPLAASGTRIIMHLLYELKRRGKRYGLGSACIGGGQGIALIVERL
ncbi:acetyl-CoA C-acetyltransferase [Bdellovibrionota bacterium FG-2]